MRKNIEALRKLTDLPIVIGFGIKDGKVRGHGGTLRWSGNWKCTVAKIAKLAVVRVFQKSRSAFLLRSSKKLEKKSIKKFKYFKLMGGICEFGLIKFCL
ncbi:MAG: hypothetical protein Ct9H300mP22_6760 [Gammaproteobacteria bacterium]|nr:MAG: hypothetical protein Ct9H300mP22_6760 [Gammaproteobacteria bacterium]